ncbi:hypothetical protein ACFLTT_02200 [Chloroflexota bacterium]
MPLQVDRRQKERIRFLHQERGFGPKEIWVELEKEFGKGHAASRATIVRELRQLRLEREREFGLILEEGAITKPPGSSAKPDFVVTTKKRRKLTKPVPWTVGEKDFNDEDTAIISQVLTKATGYDITIPGKTSIALAKWIARLHKAYPLQPAIIIWYTASEAELTEFLELDQKIKVGYQHIDRFLQFQPWKGEKEESRYNEICDEEKIGWNKNWWKSRIELFQKAELSTSHKMGEERRKER